MASLKFDLPEGLDVSDLEDGDEMEVLAKIRKADDGKAILIEVEGFSLSDKDRDEIEEEEEVEEISDDVPFDQAVMQRARQAGL